MYYLTLAGGAHWAAERLPVWERYYSTTWDLGERFVITAPDRKIASHYLRSAIKCRYLRPRKRHSTYRLRDWPPEEFPPFPWPRFRRAWQLQLRVKRDNGYLSTNWECLEKERTGWSDPVELISLRLNGTPPWPETL